ncbi:hypothetical protein FG87_10105 [Nocardia vulneris]|uniref:Uncharacterized protein n=1 Tax=Nocardia vulneris TaxID=1141657 RepID=A0ABR4ZHZ6_9NOCA|nr:hypothetical protein FG87_10105 [Nocardia vulneris]
MTSAESCEDRDGLHLDEVFGDVEGGDADQRAGRCGGDSRVDRADNGWRRPTRLVAATFLLRIS